MILYVAGDNNAPTPHVDLQKKFEELWETFERLTEALQVILDPFNIIIMMTSGLDC